MSTPSLKKSLVRAFIGVLLLVSAGSVLAQSMNKPTREPKRYHAVTGLRSEKADYYFKLHAATWPGVLKMIELANIRNFSIAVKEIEGKLYLISYFEYVGDDFDADMKKIAADPETQRWWKETEPCQLPLLDAPKGTIWSDAKEVFYTK
jgi:L-rhamnose mutarotase